MSEQDLQVIHNDDWCHLKSEGRLPLRLQPRRKDNADYIDDIENPYLKFVHKEIRLNAGEGN